MLCVQLAGRAENWIRRYSTPCKKGDRDCQENMLRWRPSKLLHEYMSSYHMATSRVYNTFDPGLS